MESNDDKPLPPCGHPYYIFSLDYRQNSAGLRAYYLLCHALNQLGCEAYVVAEEPVPGLNTPILTQEIRRKHQKIGLHPIAVYGETTQGNPLLGEVVVRWVLNRVGHIGGNVVFGADDLVYYWSWLYADEKKDIRTLSLPLIDRQIFCLGNAKETLREGFCYYANKYLLFGGEEKRAVAKKLKEKGTSLCQDVTMTHKEMADILRRTQTLYCYEPSAIVAEAELCGCTAVYVGTPYLEEYDLLATGIQVIPEDEIDVDCTPPPNQGYVAQLLKDERDSQELVHAFITATQAAAQDLPAIAKTTDPMIDFCARHSSQLYIYGAGKIGHHCHLVLKAMGFEIAGFVVSDGQPIPHVYDGKPVYWLSQQDKGQCGLVLAMTMAVEDVVEKMLRERGFTEFVRYSLLQR